MVKLKFKDPDIGDFPVQLDCERIQMFGPEGIGGPGFLFQINFKSEPLRSIAGTVEQLKKWDNFPAIKFDTFKEAEIFIPGLSDKTEIEMGNCWVMLNSTIKRFFVVDSKSGKDKILLHPMNTNSDAPNK